MALIVEVLNAADRAVRGRMRADGRPLTVGRGWNNDLVLEDPYVDAMHARISRAEDGSFVVEDLGSVNGLVVVREDGRAERQVSMAARGGTEVRVGRTILRFRDPAEPLPPALQDAEPEAPGGAMTASFDQQFFGRRLWRYLLPLAAAGVLAVQVWLSGYGRDTAIDAFAAVLAWAVLAAMWSGVWAIAARVVIGRFNLSGHYAVVAAATITGVMFVAAGQWAAWIFPDGVVWNVIGGGLALLLVAAIVASHLGLSSGLPARRRWRAGAITSAVILTFGTLAVIIETESFSDVPEFPGVLKPVIVSRPAPLDVDGFSEALDRLRVEVDELAADE